MKTLVILSVLDDQDGREWWKALGLPDPDRWNDEAFGDDVFATVILEERVVR